LINEFIIGGRVVSSAARNVSRPPVATKISMKQVVSIRRANSAYSTTECIYETLPSLFRSSTPTVVA